MKFKFRIGAKRPASIICAPSPSRGFLLDNIPHHQASWVTQGPKIAQIGLNFGLDDFGSTMMEENVVSAAGTDFVMPISEIERLIPEAGYEPRKRNTLYQLV